MPRATDPANHPDSPSRKPSGQSVADVRVDILTAITTAASRLTPLDLQRKVVAIHHHNRRQTRSVIRQLVAEGELNYINESGRTLVELSFNRPVQVSKRITLSPPGRSNAGYGKGAVVILETGAAFGDGRHPSTRLALAGIEMAKDELIIGQDAGQGEILDIGTGSGVLVVAALRLGFRSGIGLDIDPCALSEATKNVALNDLSDRIHIGDYPIDSLDRRFKLICANLRWPTLKSLRSQIKERMSPGGAAVFAGMKAVEAPDLIDWYAQAGFSSKWQRCRQDWAAVVMQPVD